MKRLATPALVVAAFFATGVALSYFGWSLSFTTTVWGIISSALFSFVGYKLVKQPILPAALLSVALVGLGSLALQNALPLDHTEFVGKAVANRWILRVKEAPPYQEEVNLLHCEATYTLQDSAVAHQVIGKVILRLPEPSEAYRYGDLLYVEGEIKPLLNSSTPNGFRYADYQKSLGYTHTIYSSKQPIHLGHNYALFIYIWANNLRESCLALFDQARQAHPSAVAVSEALLLGYRSHLDDSTKNLFITSGTIHILAVSGLHVGLVYGVLLLALSWWPRVKKQHRLLKALLLIAAIWAYALFTGLSPSIMRAAFMLSLFTVADALYRRVHPLQLLGLAAVGILAVDPLALLSVGFQLSFAAVYGLVVIGSAIESWYSPLQPVKKKAWQLFSFTMGAQLSTFPLAIYYFGTFPTYFLLGNFIMLPLSGLLLMSSAGYVFISATLPALSTMAGSVFFGFVELLFALLEWIISLPFAKVKGLSLRLPEVAILLVLAAVLVMAISLRSKRRLAWSGSLAFCFLAIHIYYAISVLGSKDQLTFSNRRLEAHIYRYGKHTLVLHPEELDKEDLHHQLQGYYKHHYISSHPSYLHIAEGEAEEKYDCVSSK